MKEYEIIGKDVYGTQAKHEDGMCCQHCRYETLYECNDIPCDDFFYLKDEELEKINNEKIQQLESRIKELEEEKTTELTVKYDGTFYVERTTNCCGVGMITTENYCPNCGRKIKK